jgi:hypothetical protein
VLTPGDDRILEVRGRARLTTDHVEQSEIGGVTAQAIRAGADEPALRAGIDRDHRQDLY